MKTILLIRLATPAFHINDDTIIHWGEFSVNGELQGDIHVSTISTFRNEWRRIPFESSQNEKHKMFPDRVCVLLPGEQVISGRVSVNTGQKKHIQAALPYMVEEYLAENIESLHLGCRLVGSDNEVEYSGIPHQSMQNLLSLLAQQEVSPDWILAENQLIETDSKVATIFMDGQTTTLLMPGTCALTIEYDAIELALKQSCVSMDRKQNNRQEKLETEEFNESVAQVNIIFFRQQTSFTEEKVESLRCRLIELGWLVEVVVLETTFFEWLASSYINKLASRSFINLRQGVYRSSRTTNRRIKKWRSAIVLLFIWLFVEFGLVMGKGMYYQYKSDEYWIESADAYLEVFPNDKQVLDAKSGHTYNMNLKVWLENRIKGMDRTSGATAFLPFLKSVSSASFPFQEKSSDLIPKKMEFNGVSGKISFEFIAKNLDVIDRFLMQLKDRGLEAELEKANQEKAGVIAKMLISR
ncbi:hypothetical protein CI610_02448 [invertebrate metagenome]|uniref:Type II secretion system protein L n=1 Tax=invertebrate metagenome TaxID=1711999 RepID=A0A2H9T5W7_9ZZZZ